MKLGQNRLNLRCWKLVVFLLGLGIFAGGCENCEKEIKNPDVSLDSASAAAESSNSLAGQSGADADGREQAQPGSERLLEVEAWPGQGEMLTFQLTWLGGGEEVVLRERPDEGSAEVARRSWEDGSEVGWEETRVVVLAARPFRALKDVRLEVMRFDPQMEALEAEENVVVTVSQGERIELYQYVGEETCYLGVRGQIYVGDCPGKEFQAEVAVEKGQRRLSPLEQEWWVLVGDGKARGWVRADNSWFEAHTRRMEEYE